MGNALANKESSWRTRVSKLCTYYVLTFLPHSPLSECMRVSKTCMQVYVTHKYSKQQEQTQMVSEACAVSLFSFSPSAAFGDAANVQFFPAINLCATAVYFSSGGMDKAEGRRGGEREKRRWQGSVTSPHTQPVEHNYAVRAAC